MIAVKVIEFRCLEKPQFWCVFGPWRLTYRPLPWPTFLHDNPFFNIFFLPIFYSRIGCLNFGWLWFGACMCVTIYDYIINAIDIAKPPSAKSGNIAFPGNYARQIRPSDQKHSPSSFNTPKKSSEIKIQDMSLRGFYCTLWVSGENQAMRNSFCPRLFEGRSRYEIGGLKGVVLHQLTPELLDCRNSSLCYHTTPGAGSRQFLSFFFVSWSDSDTSDIL
ncbi:hypothetical protein L873DRAFT_672787 [Choiromyces venosus 120613-1]|uniref:Uncharacterized protein n=1 Tax=Choiromyces venosus 120613-1 TaxID=1336337 RepID=A0A3N4JSX9_9PEZI|nr:hypothetical protein L873DRAFT_672787 [Choiromyces venosus 120613-1]